MPRYKFVVMTKPVAGREREYNDWYQNVHLRDVVAIDGIQSAQRFRLSLSVQADPPPFPYLAIYEIETEDIEGTIEEMKRRTQSGEMFISNAMSGELFAAAYEELAPPVKA
ncbi:MAG TPA: hypothetical protein VK437_07335 [Steroidobacteraceae bacterium]|nr:hypothetical protein [Steroidobacteraceae bacterium]